MPRHRSTDATVVFDSQQFQNPGIVDGSQADVDVGLDFWRGTRAQMADTALCKSEAVILRSKTAEGSLVVSIYLLVVRNADTFCFHYEGYRTGKEPCQPRVQRQAAGTRVGHASIRADDARLAEASVWFSATARHSFVLASDQPLNQFNANPRCDRASLLQKSNVAQSQPASRPAGHLGIYHRPIS